MEKNCRACKHYLPHDIENACYDCELGLLDPNTRIMPKDCSGYEYICSKSADVQNQEGKKYDTGKNRIGLMCENFSRALWKVAEVSTFGASKYGDNTWQKLSNPQKRYLDALCRHLFQHLQGDKVDNESGLLHLQHCAWNILALLEFELKEEKEN